MPGRVGPNLDAVGRPEEALEEDDDGAHRSYAQRLRLPTGPSLAPQAWRWTMAWNEEEEEEEEEEEAAVEEEEEEEETLQKITKEDHATARPTSCPNTGRILCALLRSRPATSARAATLRHSVTLHIRSLTRTLGPSSATSAGERRTLEWSASWLGCQPGIVLSATPSP